MNTKTARLVLFVLVIAAVGFGFLRYHLSFKTVYIDIKHPGVSVTIYNSKKKQVTALPASGKLSLKTGKYSVVPGGTNISTKAIPLTVNETGAYLTVDPGYSQAYLNQLLQGEIGDIKAVITSTYPNAISDFSINTGSLYTYGDWYATTLVQNPPGPGASGDVYRTVLHKVQDKWQVAATPAIALSVKEYPHIPKPVLDSINKQTGY